MIVGTTMGEIQEEEAFTRWICGKGEEVRPAFGERYPAYQIAHAVAEYYHAAGPAMSYPPPVPQEIMLSLWQNSCCKRDMPISCWSVAWMYSPRGVRRFSASAFLSPPIAAVRLIGPGKGWCWEKDADFLFWRGKAKGSGKTITAVLVPASPPMQAI